MPCRSTGQQRFLAGGEDRSHIARLEARRSMPYPIDATVLQ
jgi:hypothetical protein